MWVSAAEANAARARRRALNARTDEPAVIDEPRTVREIIEAFEAGTEDLHGFPRGAVDFPALYDALERAGL